MERLRFGGEAGLIERRRSAHIVVRIQGAAYNE